MLSHLSDGCMDHCLTKPSNHFGLFLFRLGLSSSSLFSPIFTFPSGLPEASSNIVSAYKKLRMKSLIKTQHLLINLFMVCYKENSISTNLLVIGEAILES